MSTAPTATPLPRDGIECREMTLETPAPPADVELQPARNLIITEQEVVFSTTAAVWSAPTRRWARATRTVAVAMRRILPASSEDSRPKRLYYPPRATFLEDSRMEREMHRL